jgi:hypothetical protein
MSESSRYEALSRLLAGELGEADEIALRHQIDRDPELAQAWELMQQLGSSVSQLEESPAPSSLDDAALEAMIAAGQSAETRSPAPRRPISRSTPARHSRWLGWAVAAAAILALFLIPRPDQTLVLVEGQQLVQGHVDVLAGTIPVRVKGTSLISVEPPPEHQRATGQEVSMNYRTLLAGATAGALVTVSVYEGSARLGIDDADAMVLHAGQSASMTRQGDGSIDAEILPMADPSSQADSSKKDPGNRGSRYHSPTAGVAPFPSELAAETDEATDATEPDAEFGAEEGEQEPELFPLSKEGINDAIRERLGEIRDCYQAWLEVDPELAGKVVVKFHVRENDEGYGEVYEALTQEGTDTNNDFFEGCVVNVMSELRFEPPADGGMMTVSYPFMFKSDASDEPSEPEPPAPSDGDESGTEDDYEVLIETED